MDEYGRKHLLAHIEEAGVMEEALEDRQKKIDDFMTWLQEKTRGIVWSVDNLFGDMPSTTLELLHVIIEGRYRIGEEGAVGVRMSLKVSLLHEPKYRKGKTTEMINALAQELFGPFS